MPSAPSADVGAISESLTGSSGRFGCFSSTGFATTVGERVSGGASC
jgi:hypothetical protein